jgi:hypothetical protein
VKKGTADHIIALTALRGKLYASTSANGLLEGKSERSAITWKNIGEANQVVLLSNDGDALYGVDAGNTMYRITPGANKPWLKIGVDNSTTYAVNIKQLVVFANRLYTLGDDARLYAAIHNTDHSLSSRALAIKSKNKTVVIVTLDLTGFDYSLATAVKDVIAKKRKIPASAILINASHTHFAPVTQWFPTFGEHGQLPDSAYFNNVLKKGIIRSIELALDHMSPASIDFGRGSTNIGHNRSSQNGETPYDNVVDVLKFTNDQDRVNSLLFLTGCHPVFKNEGKEGVRISANYPGVSRKLLEEKTGAETSLFVQGCGGDINPRNDDHDQTGSALATDVLSILQQNMTPVTGGISYTLDTIAIPTHPWSKEKVNALKEEALKEPGNVYAEKNVRWANLMLGYYEQQAVPKTMPVYVQIITVGNWKLVGLSREVVTEYGPAIRAIWPDKMVSVAGYCNDVPSYLPVGRHIKAETYEGVDSFFWNAQPSLFPENIFDIVIDAIKKIKN